MRVYAIGDVHGHLDLLRQAHDRITVDGGADATVVHLGDLVDRGPDSRGVIAHLIAGQAAGRDWRVVLGNHDRLFLRFLTDRDWTDAGLSDRAHWVDHPGLGAAETLASYGVDPALPRAALHLAALRAVPGEHAVWLAGLPHWHLHPLALFVHAGVRPGVDLQDQTQDDCVWIRRPFLDSAADFGPLVVHGHSPVKAPSHYGNRLNIDTGAAYGGPLTAVVIEPSGVWALTDQGRVPVERVGR
ncbi:MAG: metallophosphoesterase [Paracoccus sp. (in: a-proteobacteria)]|uniref:metallophosphoesterase n=1 Tax=Paracoccus sp. TaxID=267 RepID=UPI0026DFA15C|nr:metallophosphoesterase [Paracoccus sp. (in: a-proteobacteria)]MDO5611957.1 metallophosphoesterase [Paracoccus sp. (in: a-proteobacteria)]